MTEEKKKTAAKTVKAAPKTAKAPKAVKSVKEEKIVVQAAEISEKPAVETPEEELEIKAISKKGYYEAVGRRKSSIARVRLSAKKLGLEVNGVALNKYFSVQRLAKKAFAPLDKMKISDKIGGTVRVVGGGIASQADAICLGVARALTDFNPEFKKRLRKYGYMTRDARAVERKKFGLKKARRAPQWVKR